MVRTAYLASLAFVLLIPVQSGQAALIFEFAVGGTPTTSITIPNVGDTVPVQVYLTQTSPDDILTTEGLDLAAIRVSFGSPTVAAVLTVGDIAPGAGFVSISTAVNPAPYPPPPTSADLNEEAPGLPPATVFPPLGGNSILLGTFTFTGLAAGATAISVTDLDEGGVLDDIVTGLGTSLDGLITAGTGTITVLSSSAIPEPSSLALSMLAFGAASVVVTYRRRRNRRGEVTGSPSPTQV